MPKCVVSLTISRFTEDMHLAEVDLNTINLLFLVGRAQSSFGKLWFHVGE